MSRDPYGHFDAAYVLGALSAGERQEFERHLADCDRCRRAVADVAGLPGLLSRLDPADLERDPARVEGVDDPLPDTLLPRLLAEVSRESRRRRTRVFALSAAAAAAVAAVSVGVTAGVVGGQSPSSPTAVNVAAQPMTQLGQTQLTARVAMEPVAWGTRLSITCRYQTQGYTDAAALPDYSLVVRTRDGAEQQVATWRAVAGTPTTVTAATAARASQIASVEVRTTKGKPVLRLAG